MRSTCKFLKVLWVVKTSGGGGVCRQGSKVIRAQRRELTYFVNIWGEESFEIEHFFKSPAGMFPDVNDWQQSITNLRVEVYTRSLRQPIMFDGRVRPSGDLTYDMNDLTVEITRNVWYRSKKSKCVFSKFYVLQFKIFSKGSN